MNPAPSALPVEPLDLGPVLGPADALIIVPPFAQLELPAMSPHVLQASARAAGLEVRVLYASILFARHMGEPAYTRFVKKNTFNATLPGERVFARAAHGLPPFGRMADRLDDDVTRLGPAKAAQLCGTPDIYPVCERLDPDAMAPLEASVPAWVEAVADAVADLRFDVVGCTTSFEQTNAALSLLGALKRRQPNVATVLGGANCSGEMAQGILSLDPDDHAVDHVFSGESESAFVQFLLHRRDGEGAPRLVQGRGPRDLDELGLPDYGEFFEQLEHFLPGFLDDNPDVGVPFETSRGCYWRQAGGCTFCGLNLDTTGHRSKSPDRIAADLRELCRRQPGRVVAMADNTMPRSHLRRLVPQLPEAEYFFSVRPDLSLSEVVALAGAGIIYVLPGIESLVTPHLELMNKGVTALQNIQFLRYARSAGVFPYYNLLWGFPGDDAAWYRRSLELVELMGHLTPPRGVYHLSVDRFSPCWERPSDFGIRDVRPMPCYSHVYPEDADVARLAYHFTGDYRSGAYDHPELIRQLMDRIDGWRMAWKEGRAPMLKVARLGGSFLLVDTRRVGGVDGARIISAERARSLLTARPLVDDEETRWALDLQLGVEVDGSFVPLATAVPELLAAMEAEI